MKSTCNYLCAAIQLFLVSMGLAQKSGLVSTIFEFTENKHQLIDQHLQPRNDVLFYGTTADYAVYFTKTGLSYQLSEVLATKQLSSDYRKRDLVVPTEYALKRLDIEWLNTSAGSAPAASGQLPGVSNFYLEHCPEGITGVRAYSDLYYHAIYPGINLHYYGVEAGLKYDIEVGANADYQKIAFRVTGADELRINDNGELVMQVGNRAIIEQAPLVMQGDKRLKARWKLMQDEVHYEIEGVNKRLPFVIDPLLRAWGTYIGNNNGDTYCEANSVVNDASGNVYVAGSTANANNLIVSTGAHQTNFGGGSEDAYLIKYSANGTRLWGTFYGGNGIERGNDCAVDANGNVFLTGETGSSGAAIASAGSHQTVNNSGLYSNAFLVKFNSSGQRLWGTFYGGSVSESAFTCCTDLAGNVFIGGQAYSSNAVATAGSYQTSLLSFGDGFFAKFDAQGTCLWGSYIGGWGTMGYDIVSGMSCDASGNLILCGSISSTSSIGTAGVFQPVPIGGEQDGFVSKFDGSGAMIWSTYYGANTFAGNDIVNDCVIDNSGNIYIAGTVASVYGFTNSPLPAASPNSLIATPGAYQSNESMTGYDIYVAKLNSSGNRVWGSYFGAGVFCSAIARDGNGDIYVCGSIGAGGPTNTTVMTPACHQPTMSGTGDAFFAKLDANGTNLLYATYYGGLREELANDCTVDGNSNFYFVGNTNSYIGTAIATPGTQQPSYGGNASWGTYAGFLVKFSDCAALSNSITSSNALCNGSQTGTIQIAVGANIGPVSYNWQPGGFNTPSIAVGAGTYSCVMQSTCGIIAWQSATVTQPPPIQVSAGSSQTVVCAGSAVAVSFSASGGTGAIAANWPAGSTVLSANSAMVPVTQNTLVSISVNDANACAATASLQVQILNCVSIDQETEPHTEIQLLPNPAQTTVRVLGAKGQIVTVYASSGQMVLQVVVAANDQLMDVTPLSKGLYSIQVSGSGSTKNIKMIKQ